MEIIFSFDTEDYVDPVSNDALLRLAEIHTEYEVPATFGIVGEKARFLRNLGREDVIEAVGRHEVGYHSDHHFILPDPTYDPPHVPAYTEEQPWDRAVARLLAEESRGIRDIAESFGQRPSTFLRTFGDWGPQMMVAYAQLGVPVFAYGPVFYNQDIPPMWYCNQLHVANPRLMYEDNLHRPDMSAQEKLEQHKANLLGHLEQGTPRLGWVTHPTRFIADTWWEAPNWFDRLGPWPRQNWRIPERFSPARTEELLWIAQGLVEFVSGLSDLTPRTFREFYEDFRPTRRWVSPEEAASLAARVGERPEMLRLGEETFSPAELFGTFAHRLGAPEGGAAGERTPLRHLIGPTEEPVATDTAFCVGREDFRDACRLVELFIRDRDRVPAAIAVGRGEVGPGAFFVAMAQALREPQAERITIPSADNLPVPQKPDDYDRMAQGRPLGFVQYWSNREDYDFPNTRRHAQLQYWTFKTAAKGGRGQASVGR